VPSPRSPQSRSKVDPHWKIDRVELLYYDPLHLQWQMFHAGSPEAESSLHNPHRIYIQELLASVWELLKKSTDFKGAEVTLSDSAITENEIELTFPEGALRNLRKFSKERPDLWRELIGMLIVRARDEQLLSDGYSEVTAADINPVESHRSSCGESEPSGRFGLIARINEISKYITDSQEEGRGEATVPRISLVEALDLISILPIRRHWEPFGVWAGFYSNQKRRGENELRRGANVSAGIPFFYVTKLTYKSKKTANPRSKSKSAKLLGDEVQLEVFKAKVDDASASPESSGKVDFFDYCFYPRQNKWRRDNPEAFYGDEILYQFYGFMIDMINRSLYKANADTSNEKAAKDSGGADEDIFIIAYPLTTLGRTHFLQIYISPSQTARGEDKHGLARLWFDWLPVHKNLNWGEAKVCLAEDMEQIDLSLFQSRVNTVWPTPYPEFAELPREVHLGSICHFAPYLFDLSCLAYSNKVWKYGYKYIYINGKPEITLSHQWRIDAGADRFLITDKPTLHVNGVEVWYEDESNIRALYDKRRYLIFQQQRDLSRNLDAALSNERQEKRGQLRRGLTSKVHGWTSEDKKKLLDYIEAVEEESLLADKGPTVEQPGAGFQKLVTPWREANIDGSLGCCSSDVEQLKAVLRPSITELLSEYFETGVVKHITHSNAHYKGSKAETILCLQEVYNRLSERLRRIVRNSPPPMKMLLEGVAEFHDDCHMYLSNFKDDASLDQIYIRKLEVQRREFRKRFTWRDGTIIKNHDWNTLNLNEEGYGYLHFDLGNAFESGFMKLAGWFKNFGRNPTFTVRPIKITDFRKDEKHIHPASLYRVYFSWLFEGEVPGFPYSLTKADFLHAFWLSSLGEFGRFYTVRCLPPQNQYEIYDLTQQNSNPLEVSTNVVFPLPEGLSKVLNGAGNWDVGLILAFDTWYVED
jgi:hypothetical protein